ADGEHTVLFGAAVLVDFDEALVVQPHLGAVEAEILGERPPADRHHDGVDGDGVVGQLHRGAPVGRLMAFHLDAGTHVDAPLFERSATASAASLSHSGNSLGRASRSVTWVPRSLIIDAN